MLIAGNSWDRSDGSDESDESDGCSCHLWKTHFFFYECFAWGTMDGDGVGQYGDWRSRRLMIICCADVYLLV